jgi:hypothetical protein
LVGAETGIKTVAAVHTQCRSWVKSGQTIAGQNPLLSVVTPIATIRRRKRLMRYFDESDGKPERIGKVIADIFSALVYLSVLILMTSHFS